MADPRETPAMQQYFGFKRKHPGCVLLFRMGDFYEAFDEDAVTLSKALGLTLTQRTAGLPMAGVPYHQLDTYLRRLIAQGFRVAVAEQVQDPKEAKGLVARAVTRVLTPGTLVDDGLLDDDAPCTLAAACFTGEGDDSPASLAIVELSTGGFVLRDCEAGTVIDELSRAGVTELLHCATADGKPPARVKRVLDALRLAGTARPSWEFRPDEAKRQLGEHFGVATLRGFGLADDDPALAAAGAVLAYLRQTQTISEQDAADLPPTARAMRAGLSHLRPPRRDDAATVCVIDAVSLRALEVERTLRPVGNGQDSARAGDGSLLGTLLATPDAFRTPMGRRLIREWLCRPLRDLGAIRARQKCVATLVEDRRTAADLRGVIGQVQDVARIVGRLALARATPRDLVALGRSLAAAPRLVEITRPCDAFAALASALDAAWNESRGLAESIVGSCVDSPPAHLRDGGLFKEGADAALDEARGLERDAGSFLAAYQERLSRELEIPGLRVGFNRVFGYYVELSSAQARALGGRAGDGALIRKQTLKNAERYTTPELAELESKITGAQARALERERELFEDFCRRASGLFDAAARFAASVAELDALMGLAERAHRRGWKCPEIVEEPALTIHAGRHPVLEQVLETSFVPNDLELGPAPSRASLALITGPNMAGKSTFIRQVALIVLLAHIGSFVPADRATIGLTDRIFTRIGADDALHSGQSTFMVEMTETANILNHATGRSLVILDEVGRGTSTLDGLSLAWAIAEHLGGSDGATKGQGDRVKRPAGDAPDASSLRHSAAPSLPPRTLFATHYHELTDLEERLPGRVANLHVAVREWPGADGHAEIIFLHRILPGRTDQSYGIHVAKLAGLPRGVVERAQDLLKTLAVQHGPGEAARARAPRAPDAPSAQLGLFGAPEPHPAVEALRELKIEALSPLQAFDRLRELKDAADAPPRSA